MRINRNETVTIREWREGRAIRRGRRVKQVSPVVLGVAWALAIDVLVIASVIALFTGG